MGLITVQDRQRALEFSQASQVMVGEQAVVFHLDAVHIHTADSYIKISQHGRGDQESVGSSVGDGAASDDVDGFGAPAAVHDLNQFIEIGVQVDAALLLDHRGVVLLRLESESGVVAAHGRPP